MNGDLDHVSESHFLLKGTIDDVMASYDKENMQG